MDLYVNKNVTIQAIATAIRIDANNFPDAAFRNYILQNVDANHNQELENDEIKTTSSMNVSSKGISNMTGLKYFTALTQLDCSYNSISALDLTNAPRLVRLECVANNLTTLSVVKNTNINYIDCTDNAALTKLETYVYNSAKIFGVSCVFFNFLS